MYFKLLPPPSETGKSNTTLSTNKKLEKGDKQLLVGQRILKTTNGYYKPVGVNNRCLPK
jgi:hypothetical protein